MNKVQTNNSYLEGKVKLRLENLPGENTINVLDCYRGNSEIWDKIKKSTDKQINIIGIDKKNYGGLYLKGDNLKFLKTLDLKIFDIIDLDSYGVPYEQLEIIFKKEYKGIIFVTFIQSQFGRLNNKLLIKLGYTKKMINKIPTLFSRNGFEKFKLYLKSCGISRIKSLNYNNKHYIFFKKTN